VQTLAMLSRSQKSPPDAIELRPVVDRVAVLLRQCLEPRIRLDVPLWPSDTWTVRAHANDVMEVLIQAALSVNDGIEEGGVLALTAENTALRSPAGKDGQFVRLTLSATAHESFAPDTSHQTSWVREPDAKWIHSIPSLSRVLKEMNAWIEVEQRGPKSAALHLLLPRGELNLVGEQPASGSLRSRKIDGKERILVVDDEELVRMVIRAILVHRGYQVIEADNGEAAVAKYLLAPDDFDLILIDMNMPRLSGRDALVQIRQRHPHVRAIILSGGMEDPDHGTAPGLEGVVFFRKPFDNQELLRTVRKSLDTPVAKG
jgi:CheY-like chemotaxis protein